MITTNEHGFKLCPDLDGTFSLIFDSSKPKECVDYAIKNGYKRIMLWSHHCPISYELDDLLPLKDFINELLIGDEKVSYKNLNQFKNLTSLIAFDNGIDTIDLNWFPNLISLVCNTTNRLIGLENCGNLKFIQIVNFKPKDKSLLGISNLKNLEKLNVIQTNIQSLTGIEKLDKLKELYIYQASSLENIEALQTLHKNLSKIEIEKCKKISDYKVLGKVHSLKKIRISDSGEIKSLAFIKELSNLETITFVGTTIVDGNISYCERLDFVGFENKKHYSHKSEQFKEKNSIYVKSQNK